MSYLFKDDYDKPHTIAAGAQMPLNVAGRSINVISLDVDTLEFSVDDQPFRQIHEKMEFRPYFDSPADHFKKVVLKNSGGAPITARVIIGFGEMLDRRTSITGAVSVTGNVNVVSAAPTLDTSTDSVTATTSKKVITGAATQKRVLVSNLLANGTVITVGDSGVSATNGIQIPIGAALELDTQSDVWVYNPSAGTINVGLAVLSGT